MSGQALEIRLSTATEGQILAHLSRCDATFSPRLSERVDLPSYARKISTRSRTFEAWSGGELVGLVAAYLNDHASRNGFITSVSVQEGFTGRGIASLLIRACLQEAAQAGMALLRLEVGAENRRAIHVYEELGFRTERRGVTGVTMKFTIGNPQMNETRDYDREARDAAGHKYAYEFDFDVMHPFMLRSFQPFFRAGSCLELGSFKGDFTRRLTPHFSEITCVEASGEAIAIARERLKDAVRFVNARFESAQLPGQYDNIILTHVLEHLDDPVQVLARVNRDWLSPLGRLFLACPNANAPSRQIAVKMGLIAHNAAVTPAEADHGHRCTYSLDTLERDAVAGGLKVIHRSGIFFKALANFQWDRLLATDIISPEYLEGCYKLGQHYPDLCSSIFLVCERG